MNASDVLHYGHDFVLRNLADLPQEHWDTENVCGWWSTKNILAHLTSFEYVLNEVTRSYIGGGPTPYLEQFIADHGKFNDFQVDIRKNKTPQETFDEYQARHALNMEHLAQIPVETRRRAGTLPWYGNEYDLEDFIVYQYYGHKREHMSQVNVFKDSLKHSGVLPAGE
jgi:hypothetical protein